MADRKITALDPVEATDLSNDNTLIQFVNPNRVLEIDRNRRGTLADVASGVLRRSPDGTEALPALRFVSDQNTGLYRVAADVLGLAAGGSVRAKVANTSPYFTVNDGSDREVWHDGNATVTANANGTAVRLPNGIQLAWATTAVAFGSGDGVWTYPLAFDVVPLVLGIGRRSDSTVTSVGILSTALSATEVTFTRSATATIAGFAIGTWS